MNLLCRLGIHSFKRVSKPVPTQKEDEFDLIPHGCALGKCRRCQTFKMLICYGGLEPYYLSEVKTEEEWLKELVAEYKELYKDEED